MLFLAICQEAILPFLIFIILGRARLAPLIQKIPTSDFRHPTSILEIFSCFYLLKYALCNMIKEKFGGTCMRSRFHKRTNRSNFNIEPILLIKILLIVGLSIIFFMLLKHIISGFIVNSEFEKDITEFANKNQETAFEINEIILYSSANARVNEQSGFDISQFTDISFNISNPKNKVIQSLVINDINFSPAPESRNSCICL